MKPESHLMLRVADLALHSMNGTLSQEDFHKLEKLLEINPLAVEYFVEVLWIHIGLNSMEGISCLHEAGQKQMDQDLWQQLLLEEKTAPAVEVSKEKECMEPNPKVVYPAKEKPRLRPFAIGTLILSSAAILFIALFLYFVPVEKGTDVTLIDSLNANWAENSESMKIGSILEPEDGEHWLQGGFVKLLFGKGAQVVIEAPARFEILSDKELNILSGRAYSTVAGGAEGFTIFTPNSQVIDLGTEFGVEVLNGHSSVHMIKGKAAVIPNSTLRTQKAIELTAGQAKVIAQNGITQDAKVDKEKFISDISSKMRMIYRAGTAIQIGTWDRLLSANLERDLRTDGRLIQAVNLGPQSIKPGSVCGISFKPLTESGIVTGGREVEIDDRFKTYNESDDDFSPLLNSGIALDNQKKTHIQIQIDDLEIGNEYRLQLIFNFPWNWCDINCYGFEAEYMYFPNEMSEAQLGLATYTWNARATTGKIELTCPHKAGEWNLVHVLGYVIHEVGKGYLESL